MGFFSKRAKRREPVIDLRRLQCPACGGRNTEIGWMDRVARASGHWCDDCGHAWKTVEVSPQKIDETAEKPSALRF